MAEGGLSAPRHRARLLVMTDSSPQFTRKRFARGYAVEHVDAFLASVQAALTQGAEVPNIRAVSFTSQMGDTTKRRSTTSWMRCAAGQQVQAPARPVKAHESSSLTICLSPQHSRWSEASEGAIASRT